MHVILQGEDAGEPVSPEPVVTSRACGPLARDGIQLSRLRPTFDLDVSCRVAVDPRAVCLIPIEQAAAVQPQATLRPADD
jgi:hypothetical protein